MDRIKLKEKAIKLRGKGKTYLEIQNSLGIVIPKSTLSYWSKDVELPKEYQKKIRKIISNNAQKGRAVALIVNRIKREKYLKDLKKRNLYLLKKLHKDVLKIALSVLYLGEGAKWKSHRGLMLGSSDPVIVKLFIKLLNICYGIKTKQLKVRVSYRADQDIETLQRFWSRTTKIPLSNFYKTIPDPRTKGKKTQKKDYRGVCVISYGSTEIQLELETIPLIIYDSLTGP